MRDPLTRANPLRTVVAAAFAAFLAVAGCSRGPDGDSDPVACRIRDEFRRQTRAALWPGFEPAGTALAVYDGESTWLFGVPRPVDGFAPEARCADAQRVLGQHANVRANTAVDWDGMAVATLLASTVHADSVAEAAATAIHETFHVFQRTHHPRWAADEGVLFEYPATSESLLVLAKMEMEALRLGVRATDAGESAQWARTAVDLRQRRATLLPQAAMAYERATECNEGLAQYVERRALEHARGQAAGSRAALGDEFPADGVRWRCYASGEAWALLLDRHRRGWKRQIAAADSVPLDAWLATAPAVASAAPVALDAATTARCAASARRAVAALRESRLQEGRRFLARPGHTLVFESAQGPWWPEGFDPLNVRVLNDGVVLHQRWLRLSNASDRIEVLDREALSEPAGPHPLFSGVRRLVIAGLDSPPALVGAESVLVVQAPGVEATLRNATATTAGQRIVVRAGR